MRDYNFFSSIENRGAAGKKQNILVSAAAAGLAIVAVATLALFGVQTLLKMQMTNANAYLASNADKATELSIKQNKLSIIKKYSTYIKGVTGDITGIDLINPDLLDKINSALPGSTTISSMIINAETLDLTVTTDNKGKAPELITNLKNLNLFSEVNLGQIAIVEANNETKVIVTCVFKDVIVQ